MGFKKAEETVPKFLNKAKLENCYKTSKKRGKRIRTPYQRLGHIYIYIYIYTYIYIYIYKVLIMGRELEVMIDSGSEISLLKEESF